MRRRAQDVQFGQCRIEVTVDVRLLQYVTLHFTAGGLRDFPYGNDPGNLQARMFVHQTADRLGRRYKLGHSAAMEDEYHEFLALGAELAYAGHHHFAEIEARRASCNVFQIIRIIVLTVDNDDFLGSAGDIELSLVDDAEIAGIEPALAVERV